MALLATSGKSGELRVVGGHIEGRLWLHDGQLVSSAVGKDHDYVDAMFELLRLSEGTFVFKDGVEAAEPEAPAAVEPIVRQAQERLQEWRQIEAVVPTLEHRVRLVPELPAPEVTLSSNDWTLVTAVALAGTVRGVVEELQVNYFDACRGLKRLVDAGLVLVEAPRVRGASVELSHGGRRNGASPAVTDTTNGATTSLSSPRPNMNERAPAAPVAHADGANGAHAVMASVDGAHDSSPAMASAHAARPTEAAQGSSSVAAIGTESSHGTRSGHDDESSPFASVLNAAALHPSAPSFSFEPATLVPSRPLDSSLSPSAPTTSHDSDTVGTDQGRRRRVSPDWRLPKDAEPVRVLRHEPAPEDDDAGELAVVRHLFLNPSDSDHTGNTDWDGWHHTPADTGADETNNAAPAPIRVIRPVATEPARSDEAVMPPAASFSLPEAGAPAPEAARRVPAAPAESSHERDESINRGLLLKFLSSVKP